MRSNACEVFLLKASFLYIYGWKRLSYPQSSLKLFRYNHSPILNPGFNVTPESSYCIILFSYPLLLNSPCGLLAQNTG
jgi:hypothetical protein